MLIKFINMLIKFITNVPLTKFSLFCILKVLALDFHRLYRLLSSLVIIFVAIVFFYALRRIVTLKLIYFLFSRLQKLIRKQLSGLSLRWTLLFLLIRVINLLVWSLKRNFLTLLLKGFEIQFFLHQFYSIYKFY